MNNFPKIEKSSYLKCAFVRGEVDETTDAVTTSDGVIECHTPQYNRLPKIPTGTGKYGLHSFHTDTIVVEDVLPQIRGEPFCVLFYQKIMLEFFLSNVFKSDLVPDC